MKLKSKNINFIFDKHRIFFQASAKQHLRKRQDKQFKIKMTVFGVVTVLWQESRRKVKD
jgi:hypothetical protein